MSGTASSTESNRLSTTTSTDGFTVPVVRRVDVAHRVVQLGILLTLVWKWKFFRFANAVYETIPLNDSFFPEMFRSVFVLRLAFLAAVGSVILNLLTGNQTIRRWCCWITLTSTTMLCLHQGSHNDMTFVTAWWTSLWAVWFCYRVGKDSETVLLRRAAFLSRLIISVILLGGAAGKWTAEYWSGEVFYDIYFRDRDFWVFNLLRSQFDVDALREISMWYSRKVVVIETVCGLVLWLLPPKWAAGLAMVVLASIALLSNTLLFSVLSCLIALASVGFLVKKPTKEQASMLSTTAANQS